MVRIAGCGPPAAHASQDERGSNNAGNEAERRNLRGILRTTKVSQGCNPVNGDDGQADEVGVVAELGLEDVCGGTGGIRQDRGEAEQGLRPLQPRGNQRGAGTKRGFDPTEDTALRPTRSELGGNEGSRDEEREDRDDVEREHLHTRLRHHGHVAQREEQCCGHADQRDKGDARRARRRCVRSLG